MHIVGHCIGDDILDGVFDMSRQFFDLPDAEKRQIHISRSPQYRGYLGLLEKGNTDPSFKGNNLEAFHYANELKENNHDVKRVAGPISGLRRRTDFGISSIPTMSGPTRSERPCSNYWRRASASPPTHS